MNAPRPHRPERAGATIALAVAFALALSACTGTDQAPKPGPDEFTAEDARKVVERYYAEKVKADGANNGTLARQLETGPVLASTLVAYQDSVAASRARDGKPDDGAEDVDEPVPETRDIRAFVPRVADGRTEFLAIVTRTAAWSSPWREVLVVTRTDARAPWLVRLSTMLADNLPLPAIAVDGQGHATRLGERDQATLLLPAKEVARRLGGFFGSADHRELDDLAGFAPGPRTTVAARNSFDFFNRPNGWGHGKRYTGPSGEPSAWHTDDGSAFVVAGLGMETVFGAKSGRVQQDPSRNNWGGQIAPGTYSQIIDVSTVTVTAEVPTRTGGAKEARVDVTGLVDWPTGQRTKDHRPLDE